MSTASKARKSYRGVAQFGRALRSGRRGRVFESRRLDSIIKHTACWSSSNLVASTYLNTKACWSSGQDDALSRRKPGFDSRTGHWKEIRDSSLFFIFFILDLSPNHVNYN